MADPTIKIKLETDSTQAQKGLEQTATKAESFGSRFKSTFAGVLAAGVVQNLASKVFEFGKQSVEAYDKAEQTQTKFLDAMRRIPGASDATTKALEAQAKALAQVTIYSAGQSKAALASLASFGLTGDQLKTLLPLVQDYAAKTGQQLPDAANAIGKAILGQGRALKGVGIDFKNTGSAAGNFAEIVQGLQTHVGGLAQQMGQTSAGQMAIMENKVTALKVAVGSGLVPAIQAILPVLTPVMSFIAANAQWLVPLAIGIIAVAGAFIFLNFAVGLFMANPPVLLLLAIAAAVVGLIAVVILLANYWQTIWHWMLVAVHWVWDFIVAYWPYLLGILLGPIGIAAGLIIQNFSAVWGFIRGVWSWIAGAWNAVYGWITSPFIAAWGAIRSVWGGVVGFFAGIVGAIGAAFAAVYHAIVAPFEAAINFVKSLISGLKGAWNAVANVVNAVHISFPGLSILGHEIIPGFDWRPPFRIPTLARGGLMTSDGLVYAHAGEVISPAPASATRSGPAIVIQSATFATELDVDSFLRRATFELNRQRV